MKVSPQEPEEVPELSIEHNPQFQKNLRFIHDLVGDEVSFDKIKYLLRGADGNVEIALNHLLNDLEKDQTAEIDSAESISISERMETILSDLAEEVKCPLCLSYFSQPVVLHCLHTYCTACLEAIVNNNNHIECPLCRSVSTLDDQGVRGLKYNHYLANIVEKLKMAQSTRMCAECQNYICAVFCKQCKAFLCNECNDKIHSMKLLYAHHRLPFEDCFFPTPRSSISPTKRMRSASTVDESDAVIPFNVKKEVCIDLWNSWLKSIWFAPSDFMKKTIPLEFTAVYMPYWLFELEASVKYNCTVGFSEKLAGKSEFAMVAPAFGSTNRRYDDLTVCASDSLEAGLLEFIGPWKLEQIQRITLKHTENTVVRAFTISVDDAWQVAKKALDRRLQSECEKELRLTRPVEKIRDFSIDTTVIQKRARRLFVPVYTTTCEYRGRDYTFVVNGSTARVYGQRPYSTSKLASLSFTGLGAAIGLLTSTRFRG